MVHWDASPKNLAIQVGVYSLKEQIKSSDLKQEQHVISEKKLNSFNKLHFFVFSIYRSFFYIYIYWILSFYSACHDNTWSFEIHKLWQHYWLKNFLSSSHYIVFNSQDKFMVILYRSDPIYFKNKILVGKKYILLCLFRNYLNVLKLQA